MFIIYRLVNKVNSKCYVGVTNNYPKRMREHSYASNNFMISKAIKKYGWKNFVNEVLYETDDSDIAYHFAESHYIKIFDSMNPSRGYNLTEGGQGNIGYVPSNETRQKMRTAKLHRKLTEEHKKNISKSLFSKSANQKQWTLVSPEGETVAVTNITKFCEDNNIRYLGIWRVLNGYRNHHKGWKAPNQ